MLGGCARNCARKSRLTRAGRVGDQSLTWLAMDEEFEGDLFGDLPRGGYASVITALAPGIDVRLNTEVCPSRSRSTASVSHARTGRSSPARTPLSRCRWACSSAAARASPHRYPRRCSVRSSSSPSVVTRRSRCGSSQPFWRDEGVSHLVVFPEPRRRAVDVDLRSRCVRRGSGAVRASVPHR